MAERLTNYDGSVTMTPARLERPQTVDELCAILADPQTYPAPVRALGSFHSLTPCPTTTGTVVSTAALKAMYEPDRNAMTFTAQAGVELIEAAAFLRERGLQFYLNVEIGNMTVGAAACCHSKDAMDGIALGQVSSYVTQVKWVTPDGKLAEASEDDNLDLLQCVRSSYGLCGVVYEATFKVMPLTIVHFSYELYDLADLNQKDVDAHLAHHQATVAWTIGNTVVLQSRDRADRLRRAWLSRVRRLVWAHVAAFLGQSVQRLTRGGPLRRFGDEVLFLIQRTAYRFLRLVGGFSFYDPDKMIDYSHTSRRSRYAFTFWAFPREQWVANLKAYVEFRDEHFKRTGFRCNLPLGSYFVRRDESSLLSYSYDGDIFSIDPIHACTPRDRPAWARFQREFNAWALARGGRPLLNQSPFLERRDVRQGFGVRWDRFSKWVRSTDPSGRMKNEFFDALCTEP